MKFPTTLFAPVAMMMLGSFFLTGCSDEETGPGPSGSGLKSQTSDNTQTSISIGGLTKGKMYAFSVAGDSGTVIKGLSSPDESTIRVFWTRGASDLAGIDTIFYQEVSSNTTTLNGAVAMTWATAIKSGPFTLFESTADDNDMGASGLVIAESGVSVVSTKSSSASNIDIILKTNTGIPLPKLTLISADQVIPTANHTTFPDKMNIPIGGAFNSFYTTSLTSNFTKDINFWNIMKKDGNPFIEGAAAVMPIKTKDNHYARIEILSFLETATGDYLLWQDDVNGYRKIVVNVYYQSVKDWGYVTPHEVDNGGLL